MRPSPKTGRFDHSTVKRYGRSTRVGLAGRPRPPPARKRSPPTPYRVYSQAIRP
jgi:hypothetical protein